MNRGIRFRAWHNKRKKHYEVIHLHRDSQGSLWATCRGLNIISQQDIHIQVQPGDCVIEQFTGLKDAELNDIYEGDIIQFTYWWFDGNEAESTLTGEIVYCDDLMSFQLKGVKNKEWEEFTGHSGEDYLTPFSELNFEKADFKIIGNIHIK